MKRPDQAEVRTEAQEARWWYDHRAELSAEMVAASREGWTGMGVAARLAQKIEAERSSGETLKSEEVTLRLSTPVLERFRASGTGWESRVDDALRQWMEEHQAS